METYELPQGKITIAFSDEKLSIGLLKLNLNQEISKHNRPVIETLLQVQGTCIMKLFEEDKLVDEVKLNEGDSLKIPENQFHIHSNPSSAISITFWKFEGNVTEVINRIRKDFKLLT